MTILTQDKINVNMRTGIHGNDYGTYEFYLDGQRIATRYNANYADAVAEFPTIAQAWRDSQAAGPVDWYICDDCGLSVDVGESCPECSDPTFVSGIPFNGEPMPGPEPMTAAQEVLG